MKFNFWQVAIDDEGTEALHQSIWMLPRISTVFQNELRQVLDEEILSSRTNCNGSEKTETHCQ